MMVVIAFMFYYPNQSKKSVNNPSEIEVLIEFNDVEIVYQQYLSEEGRFLYAFVLEKDENTYVYEIDLFSGVVCNRHKIGHSKEIYSDIGMSGEKLYFRSFRRLHFLDTSSGDIVTSDKFSFKTYGRMYIDSKDIVIAEAGGGIYFFNPDSLEIVTSFSFNRSRGQTTVSGSDDYYIMGFDENIYFFSKNDYSLIQKKDVNLVSEVVLEADSLFYISEYVGGSLKVVRENLSTKEVMWTSSSDMHSLFIDGDYIINRDSRYQVLDKQTGRVLEFLGSEYYNSSYDSTNEIIAISSGEKLKLFDKITLDLIRVFDVSVLDFDIHDDLILFCSNEGVHTLNINDLIHQ